MTMALSSFLHIVWPHRNAASPASDQSEWHLRKQQIHPQSVASTPVSHPCMPHNDSLTSLSSASSLSLSDMQLRSSSLDSLNSLNSLIRHPSGSRSRKIKFEIPAQLFKWIVHVANVHNYGSVNKTIRALLSWAADVEEDDRDWIFSAHHPLPACVVKSMKSSHGHVHHISAHKKSKDTLVDKMSTCANGNVVLEARLSAYLETWISFCVEHYKLGSGCKVLDTLCRCAIALEAEEDIFESDESGRDLPTCTADLYLDMEIHGFSPSPVSSPRVHVKQK